MLPHLLTPPQPRAALPPPHLPTPQEKAAVLISIRGGRLAEVAIALNTHEMRRPMATPLRAAVSRRRESDGGMADYL